MIIGFSGSFGSGKTTRAQYLSRKLDSMGKEYYFTNFANSLKKMVAQHFDKSFEQFNTTSGKSEICPRYSVTYGKVLQMYGQGMRNIDKDYWIHELEKEVSKKDNCIIIIGDVRYQNELDWIKSKGGHVFKKMGIRPASIAGRDINHESEKELTGYSMIFPFKTSVEEDIDLILKLVV